MSFDIAFLTTKEVEIDDKNTPKKVNKKTKEQQVAKESLKQLPSFGEASNLLVNAGENGMVVLLAQNSFEVPSTAKSMDLEAADPFKTFQFPKETVLDVCLSKNLTYYEKEKGIVAHAASFFANETKTSVGVILGAALILDDAASRGIRMPPFTAQKLLERALVKCSSSVGTRDHPANREIGDMLSEGNTALRILAAPIEAVAHTIGWTVQTVFDVNTPTLGALISKSVASLHERVTNHVQDRALDIEMSYGVPAADTVQAFSDIETLAETALIGSLVTKTARKIKSMTPVSNKTSGLTPSGHMDPKVILEHNKIAKTPPMPQTKPNPNPFETLKPLYLKVAEMGGKDIPVSSTALSLDVLKIMGSGETVNE